MAPICPVTCLRWGAGLWQEAAARGHVSPWASAVQEQPVFVRAGATAASARVSALSEISPAAAPGRPRGRRLGNFGSGGCNPQHRWTQTLE